jgi:DNA-binding transcriptional LysR family regulator
MVNLRTFDLNLLHVLDGMLSTRNTTRTGEALGLSQPAVSSALARLRAVLNDPLFVRQGQALVPTDFALSLQAPVRSALEDLASALSGGGGFDPAFLDRDYIIGASDFFYETLMPRLAATVSLQAPKVRLKVLPARTETFATQLSANAFDLVLTIDVETPSWIERRLAFRASNSVVARRGHPLIGPSRRKAMPLDLFYGLPQVIFSVTGDFVHFEDAALSRIGRSRNVRMTVPGYYGVASIVSQSDLIGILPTRFAMSASDKFGLQVLKLPFDMPLVEMFLYWRLRDTSSREQLWLRSLVLELLSPLDETGAVPSSVKGKAGR